MMGHKFRSTSFDINDRIIQRIFSIYFNRQLYNNLQSILLITYANIVMFFQLVIHKYKVNCIFSCISDHKAIFFSNPKNIIQVYAQINDIYKNIYVRILSVYCKLPSNLHQELNRNL